MIADAAFSYVAHNHTSILNPILIGIVVGGRVAWVAVVLVVRWGVDGGILVLKGLERQWLPNVLVHLLFLDLQPK